MKIDMHMHSYLSLDGEKSLLELIELAKAAGIDHLALTDHDKIDGVKAMIAIGQEHGIKVIPAVELQCLVNDHVTHILGYGIDPNTTLFDQREAEIIAIEKNCSALTVMTIKDYFKMDFEPQAMIAKAQSAMFSLVPIFAELITNPRYLTDERLLPYRKGGSRDDLPLINFYWDYCVKGKPCYVNYPYPNYQQVFNEIKAAGGIIILAHPNTTYYQNETMLQELIDHGLDGIEVFSNYHQPHVNQWFLTFAQKHQLLISAGSDYHGTYKPNIKMGEYGYTGDQELFRPLIDRLQKNQR
jgi:3',5'-nucleoside bisphosphate phosphatase